MIEFHPIDLPQAKSEEFRVWIRANGMDTLREIATAIAKKHIAAATGQALEAKDHPAKLDAANVDLARAQKWKSFLECLDEITTQKEPFFTSRLT